MVLGTKARWAFFMSLGWASHLTAAFLIWLAVAAIFGGSVLKIFSISLVFLFVWLFISAFLGSIGEESRSNFLLVPYRTFRRYKWVYHAKLGYFLMRVGPDRICVMDIGILSITEEFDLINTGNIRDLANSIKDGLDRLYEQKMAQSADANIKMEKVRRIEEWDGYLDKDESRDNKISKLLGGR